MEPSQERTLESVNEILGFAKLSRKDLIPTSQALFFTTENLQQQQSKYHLLELNNELLQHVEAGKILKIKGSDEDDLVICSENSTFHVTSAETSNSLLLMHPMKHYGDIKENVEENIEKMVVCGVFQSCLEAHNGRPSLTRLFELLKHSLYKGPEHEQDVDKSKLFTLDQLKNFIQTSDTELENLLNSLDVIEINGYIREIDFEYHFRVLSYMLKLIEENSWSLNGIDFEETVNSLSDIVPEEVLVGMFKKYTEESRMIDGVQLYKYKQQEVCQFFARVILRTAEKFKLDEFLQAWMDSVPEGMQPNEEMLYGIAIINRNSTPNVIWEFQEGTLPDNITERLQVLFSVKEKWSVPEIAPYIRSIATSSLDVNALLAKHARASKVGEQKYYSAKHSK